MEIGSPALQADSLPPVPLEKLWSSGSEVKIVLEFMCYFLMYFSCKLTVNQSFIAVQTLYPNSVFNTSQFWQAGMDRVHLWYQVLLNQTT